jgi:hypothetical protein
MRYDHWIIGGLVLGVAVMAAWLAQGVPEAAEAVALFARI